MDKPKRLQELINKIADGPLKDFVEVEDKVLVNKKGQESARETFGNKPINISAVPDFTVDDVAEVLFDKILPFPNPLGIQLSLVALVGMEEQCSQRLNIIDKEQDGVVRKDDKLLAFRAASYCMKEAQYLPLNLNEEFPYIVELIQRCLDIDSTERHHWVPKKEIRDWDKYDLVLEHEANRFLDDPEGWKPDSPSKVCDSIFEKTGDSFFERAEDQRGHSDTGKVIKDWQQKDDFRRSVIVKAAQLITTEPRYRGTDIHKFIMWWVSGEE